MQYTLLSPFDAKNAGHPESYFRERYITLDFRGGLFIHPDSHWGFGIVTLTQSHNISVGGFSSAVVNRPVKVDAHAWIASCAILYNCEIGHHAIVAVGAVVASQTVEPYTIVAGNPARVVARWSGTEWVKEKGAPGWELS